MDNSLNTPKINNVYVRDPNGEDWEIPEDKLEYAISKGGIPISREDLKNPPPLPEEAPVSEGLSTPENLPESRMYVVRDPNGEDWEIPEEHIEDAKSRGGVVIKEPQPTAPAAPPEEFTSTDRTLQFLQGFGNVGAMAGDVVNKLVTDATDAAGDITNTVGSAVGLVNKEAGDYVKDKAQALYKKRDQYEKIDFKKDYVAPAFNAVAGKDIQPKEGDTAGKILNESGEFLTPLGIGSKVNKAAKAASYTVQSGIKRIASAIGGAAAKEYGKDYKYFDENTIGGHMEDFLHALLGMIGTEKVLSGSKKLLVDGVGHNILNLVKEGKPIEAVKQLGANTAAIPLSKLSKPNAEIVKQAEELGIDLPAYMKLQGKTTWINNTLLQSAAVKNSYRKSLAHADQQAIDSITHTLDSINPNLTNREIASVEARDFLKTEKKEAKSIVDQLYNEADAALTPKDTFKPTNLQKAMKDILEEIDVPSPSKDMKFVSKIIHEIGTEWGILPPNLTEFAEAPSVMKKYLDELVNQAKSIPVKEGSKQIKALRNHAKYEKDIPGVKNFLNYLLGAVEKDIGGIANKEYLKLRDVANKFFKQDYVDRFRTKIGTELIKKENPRDAIHLLGTPEHIRMLEKSLGNSPKAQQIMSSLKRAKMEEVFTDMVTDAGGQINYGALSRMMNKKSKLAPLIEALVGKEQYKKLQKLGNISQEYVQAGKQFGNPSKTAFAAKDIKNFTDLLHFFSLISFGASSGVKGAAASAATSIGSTYSLSWALSNKKIVDAAYRLATARTLRDKEIIGGRLERLTRELSDKTAKTPQSLLALNDD